MIVRSNLVAVIDSLSTSHTALDDATKEQDFAFLGDKSMNLRLK